MYLYLKLKQKTEEKAPSVSLLNISGSVAFSDEKQPAVEEQLVTQLKAHGFYDQFSAKQPCDDSEIQITGFFSFSPTRRVNLIETNFFENIFNYSPNRTQPFVLFQHKLND